MGFGFQTATRPHPVQVTVDVKLQQIRGHVAGTAGLLGLDTHKPGRGKIEPVDEGLDEAHRVFGADVVIQGFGEKQQLGTVKTGDVGHVVILTQHMPRRNPLRRVFTRSA